MQSSDHRVGVGVVGRIKLAKNIQVEQRHQPHHNVSIIQDRFSVVSDFR